MARSRLGNQIHSFKHVIDTSGGLTSTKSIVSLALGVEVKTVDSPNQVLVGETINGIYLSIFIIGSTGAPLEGPLDWYIAKARAGQNQNTSFPDPGNTGISDVRNQIIHEEKGLSGSGDGTPMVFKGVIAIPKGMRRMREGDEIIVQLKATGADAPNFCVKAIYKSFS